MVNPTPGYGIGTPYKKRGPLWSLGFHTGADLAPGVKNAKIVSPVPGKVIAANAWDKAYGYKIVIRWGNFDVWLCHLPKNSAKVKVGDVVRAGQELGVTGITGNTTGYHLHMELRVAGGGFAAKNFRDPALAINYQSSRTAEWAKPETFVLGATGGAVTLLGTRLQVWAKHYGLAAPYKTGPGPLFTEVDRKAVAAFQIKQGWKGTAADGYPGAETLKRLLADPPVKKPTNTIDATFTLTSWNINGDVYNAGTAYTWPSRKPLVDTFLPERAASSVYLLQEITSAKQRDDIMALLGGQFESALGAGYNKLLTAWDGDKWEMITWSEQGIGYGDRKLMLVNLRHRASGVAVWFGNTHLSYDSAAKREAEAKDIVEKTKTLARYVQGGDFNNVSKSGNTPRARFGRAGLRGLRDHGFTVGNGTTNTHHKFKAPVRKGQWLDDIFIGRLVTCSKARVAIDAGRASDHFPLVATFTVKK